MKEALNLCERRAQPALSHAGQQHLREGDSRTALPNACIRSTPIFSGKVELRAQKLTVTVLPASRRTSSIICWIIAGLRSSTGIARECDDQALFCRFVAKLGDIRIGVKFVAD